MRTKIFFLCSFLILSLISLSGSQEAVRDGHVQVRLVSENASIQPGKPFWMAVELEMDKDWHIYWINPGDSGTPTHVSWELPSGFKAGPLNWPYPKKIEQPPLTSYGFDGKVLLLTQIVPSLNVPESMQTLKAKVDWLMCKVECIPGQAHVSLSLPVRKQAASIDTRWSKELAMARSKLPLSTSDWQISAQADKQNLVLQLRPPANDQAGTLRDTYFFPERDDLIKHAEKQILKRSGQGYELEIPRSNLLPDVLLSIKGVLYNAKGWRGPQSEQALAIDLPVANSPPESRPTLVLAMLFAFLGGLLLNLMPCVLPVLSIKILSLLNQWGQQRSRVRLHGLIFCLGILLSFWLLAGLLMVLQLAGQQIGWGFQFQSPVFLAILSVVFLVLALNLFGFFEITLPFSVKPASNKSSLWGSFINGSLATLAATPCTAPFMGTALGFAVTQPPAVSFLIFTFLALGLAFPFLLLCLYPQLLAFLPKPGAWMKPFKQFLGLLLLATVLWLASIFAVQVGIVPHNAPNTKTSTEIAWQPYSQKLISELQAQNRNIFIDFTAQWCLTCQANERIALNHSSVVQRFRELNVATVKADWTRQDPAIAQALAQLGKNSIPLYVLYASGSSYPRILPELLTPKTVLDALNSLDDAKMKQTIKGESL